LLSTRFAGHTGAGAVCRRVGWVRAVVEVVVGLVALRLSPRRRHVVQRPKQVHGVTDVVVVGLVVLLLSPRWRRGVQRPKVGRAVVGFVGLLPWQR
jgi:hypothetical protein